MQNYSSLQETHEPDEEAGGPLVHVAEPSRVRWNHIDDLDSFFSRMYQFHQRSGFRCLLVDEILELVKFLFVVGLSLYTVYGIDFAVLFRNVPLKDPTAKVTLRDIILPVYECVSNFTTLTWLVIVIAMAVWIVKVIKSVYQLFQFWDMKDFYNMALKFDDNDLENVTWSTVLEKVRTAQLEHQMCIHKRELSQLDIYQRILRQQNYLVAMVNKKLLPPRFDVPFLGEVVYWTTGLEQNMHLLLFWSTWSPFEHPWQVREEYKKNSPTTRQELAHKFGKHVLWLAVANLVFAPLIFTWQILHAFFGYVAVIRKEPSVLVRRRWSLYGRLYLRHFNELDHELNTRLTRAYKLTNKYLNSFSSPLSNVIAENVSFYAAAFLAVFVVFTLYDEDVLAVEHVLSIMTILTLVVAVVRPTPPEDASKADMEQMLAGIMLSTHYMPPNWMNNAHTSRVRKEMEQLCQYGFATLLEMILSPIVTPFVLWWYIYPRSHDFVDFFRNFTFSVVGVGDVCSFAQMDVKTNGNPDWHSPENKLPEQPEQYKQADDGKIEMSLMHFNSTNPSWKPPEEVQAFVKTIRNQSSSMIASLSNQNRMMDESSVNVIPGVWRLGEPVGVDAINVDDSLYSSGMLRALRAMSDGEIPHMSRMFINESLLPDSTREMSMNAAILHTMHQTNAEKRVRNTAEETTPLLMNR